MKIRWNSTFKMFQAFLEQEEALLKLRSSIPSLETLTADHFSNLKILCAILEKFDEETTKVNFLN